MPRKKKFSGENSSNSNLRSSILSINKNKLHQRNAANERERARMQVLSGAFGRLKRTLPWVPADTKLSKLDTLRLASHYISHLKGILENEQFNSHEESFHPSMTLTWPFGFNRIGGNGNASVDGYRSESDVEDGGVVDDGESCGSGSSWEEVHPSLRMDRELTKDRIHLEGSSSLNIVSKSPSNLYQLPPCSSSHHLIPNFPENLLSFS